MLYITLKYIRGTSLYEYLNTTYISPNEYQNVYWTGARSLMQLHIQGVVHGNAVVESFRVCTARSGIEDDWVNYAQSLSDRSGPHAGVPDNCFVEIDEALRSQDLETYKRSFWTRLGYQCLNKVQYYNQHVCAGKLH
jgi:hypothetical protein